MTVLIRRCGRGVAHLGPLWTGQPCACLPRDRHRRWLRWVHPLTILCVFSILIARPPGFRTCSRGRGKRCCAVQLTLGAGCRLTWSLDVVHQLHRVQWCHKYLRCHHHVLESLVSRISHLVLPILCIACGVLTGSGCTSSRTHARFMKKMKCPTAMGHSFSAMLLIIESGFVYCIAGVSVAVHFTQTTSRTDLLAY